MTRSPSMEMQTIAKAIQAWQGIAYFGASEVLCWDRAGVPAFALRGQALRIENKLFRSSTGGMLPNQRHFLDVSMQRALGLDPRADPRGYGVDGGVGQTLSEPDAHFSEVIDSMRGIIAEILGTESAHVTVMPKEGEPWNPGDRTTPYFNARTGRMHQAPPPDGLVEVEVEGEKQIGVDPCKYARIVAVSDGPVVGRTEARFAPGRRAPKRPAMDIIVTHCLSLDRAEAMGAAQALRACGGLLFPSIAVGETPATYFGPLCMVFRLGLVLEPLVTKKRGAWPIVVYKKDVWTGGVSSFVRAGAVALFRQLTGAWEASTFGVFEAHQWVLGPELADHMTGATSIVKTVEQLADAAGARSKIWSRDVPPELFEQAFVPNPFLEAKSAAVVSLESCPLAMCPEMLVREASAFLSTVGWKGDLVPVQTPPQWDSVLLGKGVVDSNQILYQYAWMLHDTAVAWASKKRLVTHLEAHL